MVFRRSLVVEIIITIIFPSSVASFCLLVVGRCRRCSLHSSPLQRQLLQQPMVRTRRQLSASARQDAGDCAPLDQRNETTGYTKSAETIVSAPYETATDARSKPSNKTLATLDTKSEKEITTCNTKTTDDASVNYDELFRWLSHDSIDFHCFPEDDTVVQQLQQDLLTWYHRHRRRLPWRGDPAPWAGSMATTTKAIYQRSAYGTYVRCERVIIVGRTHALSTTRLTDST